MLTRTVRIITAIASSICLAAAVLPAISQADTPKSTAKTGQPTISEITIMKPIDVASP